MPDARLSIFDADSFAVLEWVSPVANEAVFNREGRAQRINSVVITIGDDAAGESDRLATLLGIEENAVGIVHAIHFDDVGIGEEQGSAADFRPHAGAGEP